MSSSKQNTSKESFILTRGHTSSHPHSAVPNSFHLLKEMRFSNGLITLKGKKGTKSYDAVCKTEQSYKDIMQQSSQQDVVNIELE